MGAPRFFAPDATASGSAIDLPDDEAAHLTRVLRLHPGDHVRVFNGRGSEWAATVEQANKRIVRVTLNEPLEPSREPRIALTLAIAALKGDKMDDVVRDAVMVGVAALQPIVTARAEMSAASIARGGRMERWQRIAVSSAKQCGRAVVPEVKPVVELAAALASTEPIVMLVEPGAQVETQTVHDLPPVDRALVLIGPEGGWTSEELGRAVAAGAMLVTLGGQTLRADAAPLVAVTALRVHWEDL